MWEENLVQGVKSLVGEFIVLVKMKILTWKEWWFERVYGPSILTNHVDRLFIEKLYEVIVLDLKAQKIN